MLVSSITWVALHCSDIWYSLFQGDKLSVFFKVTLQSQGLIRNYWWWNKGLDGGGPPIRRAFVIIASFVGI